METSNAVKLKLSGVFLLILAVSMVPSLIVGLIHNETRSVFSFLIIIAICLIPGLIMYRMTKDIEIRIKMRYGFLIVTLAWLFFSLAGALPFVISGAIPNYIDAFFETCSGFSTTGSTVLTDIESLPKSMLFWRSFTHWLGGMGIIVFITAVLPSAGVEGQLIASAETPGPTMDKLTPKYQDTSRNLYLLYIGITVIETVLLLLGGLSLYDALIHSFGTVGTGGFSNYADSIGHFASPYVQWVIILFMIMCGVNFNLYFVLFKNGPKQMSKDSEFRYYLGFIGGASLIITIALIVSGAAKGLYTAVTWAVFHVASMITTTGYATTDFLEWPTFAQMVLFALFFIGASTSSTGGGIKVLRILICLKLIRRGIALKIHPNRVYMIKVNNKPVSQEIVTNIANYVFFYIVIVFVSLLLIALNGYDIITSLSAVLTCIGNVGPGFSLVGPADNFALFNGFSKTVLALLMIAGRLELFTFFMLFSPHYWDPDRA